MKLGTSTHGTRITAFAFIGMLLLSAFAIPVNASAGLNYNEGDAPNPYFNVDQVTVDEWDNGDFDQPIQYYDDAGEIATLPGEVNRSDDVDELGNGTVNPISVIATDIEVDEFGEFPRNSDESNNTASALDASEWTSDLSGSTGTGSVSDTTTAPSVEAVAVSTASQTSGDTAVFTYSNFSITSDADKRYVQLAADVNTLDAGALGEVQLKDADGDYVTVEINSSADQSANDVLANTTGEGHVSQVQIGALTVAGTGDGNMQEIQSIDVVVSDGNIAADFALINAEKKGQYTFGEKRVDTDSDDDFETETIYEPHGEFSVHSVSTFGSTFSNAVYHDLTFPAHIDAKHAPSEDVNATFDKDNAFPNWDSVAELYYRIELPSAYDLSYSGVSLDQDQKWPGSRYATVEVKEGVGDKDFEDISNWNSKESTFDTQDSTHTLDSTVSVGTEYAVHVSLKLTGDEASAMQLGGGAGPLGGDDGGLLDMVFSLPGLAVAALAGAFGRVQGWF